MKKADARKRYNQKRKDINYSDKLKWDDLILINFQTIDIPFVDVVFSFYPMESRNEVNAFLLTDHLRFRNPNLTICYPKMATEAPDMNAVVSHADTIFKANAINILEPLEKQIADPEDIDLVLVPMLVCDVQGNRVGYGKGYYDRYLSRCRPDCIKVGLSYFELIDTVDDANEYDVALNFCITPQKAYVF